MAKKRAPLDTERHNVPVLGLHDKGFYEGEKFARW
jgi:hypothetical protein